MFDIHDLNKYVFLSQFIKRNSRVSGEMLKHKRNVCTQTSTSYCRNLQVFPEYIRITCYNLIIFYSKENLKQFFGGCLLQSIILLYECRRMRLDVRSLGHVAFENIQAYASENYKHGNNLNRSCS